MGPVSGVVVFVILWWLVFFMVLPIGVKRDEAPEGGNDPGAPKYARIAKKVLMTTAIATALFALYALVVYFELVTLRPSGA